SGKELSVKDLERKCIACGQDLVARPNRGRPLKYCSIECYKVWRRQYYQRVSTVVTNCAYCGLEMAPKIPRAGAPSRYCSSTCRTRSSFYKLLAQTEPCNCSLCGQPFVRRHNPTPSKSGRRYCSPKCANAVNFPALPDTRDRLRKRRAEASRRRKLRAVVTGHRAVGRWRVICERDGWVCWICNGRIDPALCPPHRLAGTVDHVVPRTLLAILVGVIHP